MKRVLLFVLCLSFTSCAKYTISGIRNDNISINDLKNMRYKIDSTSIKYNDQDERRFAVEESEFMMALEKGLKKNFYKKHIPEDGEIMDLSIKIITDDKHEMIPNCYHTSGMNYGYHPFYRRGLLTLGGLGLGSSSYDTTACHEDNTYYDVIITGTRHSENGKEVLFETKLKYKDDMANTKKRNKELKNMLNRVTQHIGENIADRISR